jgi:hypothetical protein
MNQVGIKFLMLIMMSTLGSCSQNSEVTETEYEIQTPPNPISKGQRKFNIAPSDGESGFSATFAAMQEVGVDLVELNLEWSYFESEESIYNDPDGLLQAVGFYADNGIEIGISLATINTIKRTDPPYLNDLPYDDSKYISSFTSLIEWILETIPDRVIVDYISVGNEINYVLQGDEQWDQFKTFMKESITHLRKIYPDIKYGAKTTITDGLLGDETDQILSIIELSDVAMLNYYPQDNRFRVHDLDLIEAQLEQVMHLVDSDIYLTEVGFQSGMEYCNSSEVKQAEFYHWLFEFWDSHVEKIQFVQFNWMHDISSETLDFYGQYYGSTEGPFLEYLGTLGIKNYDETPKLAWKQIKVDANSRGWK